MTLGAGGGSTQIIFRHAQDCGEKRPQLLINRPPCFFVSRIVDEHSIFDCPFKVRKPLE